MENKSTNPLESLRTIARRSWSNLSFDPEKRGDSCINEYGKELTADLESIPEAERERYAENYKSYLSAWLHSQGNCASPMITGPARFPTDRMKKRSGWADNHFNKWREWRQRALKAINKTILRNRTPEQISDDKWDSLRKSIIESAAMVIGIDNGTQKGYTRQLFVNSITRVVEAVAKQGDTVSLNRCLNLVRELNINPKTEKPIVSDRHSMWALETVAVAAQEQQADLAARENSELQYGDTRIVYNYNIERVQIFFPGKPASEVIQSLKGSAWNWSPSHGAWQRKLTENAKHSARHIVEGLVKSSQVN